MTRRAKKSEIEGQSVMFGDDVGVRSPASGYVSDPDDLPVRRGRGRPRKTLHVPTPEEMEERRQAQEEAARKRRAARRQIPYKDRPGTKIDMSKFKNNVWFEVNGEMRPRASYDQVLHVYQRGGALNTYMECFTFSEIEAQKIKALGARVIEHIDLDHFTGDGEPILDENRCYQISFHDFAAKGHWGHTRTGLRWMVPVSAWTMIDRYGTVLWAPGTDER